MYAYFLAGPLSYTAVVSAVDATTAVACISSNRTIINNNNNNKYESSSNTTVTCIDIDLVKGEVVGQYFLYNVTPAVCSSVRPNFVSGP